MVLIKSLLVTAMMLALLRPFSAQAQNIESKQINTAARQLRQASIFGTTRQFKNETVRSELGLEDYQAVARMILHVQKSMNDKYVIGDGLTLVAYILKTFADIGDYDLSRDEILAMIAIFEKLTSLPVPADAMDIIHQLDFLRFTKINGRKSVELFTLDPAGIKLIPEASEEEGGGPLDIEYIHLQHRSKVFFSEMTRSQDRQELVDFMREAFKVPLLPTRWFKKFNQITPGVSAQMNTYLSQKRDAMPLKLSLTGMVMRVDTKSVMGTVNFAFEDAYTTPGLQSWDGKALPSFHLWMSSRTLKVKSSIDY